MSLSKLLSSVACAYAFVLLAPPKGLARDLIHKMPPLGTERLDDLIHQFPPLRPVPGTVRASAPEPPRRAWTAPTLEEAPRVAYDGPTLAELGVPPPGPPHDTSIIRTPEDVAAFDFLPGDGFSPVTEVVARENAYRAANGDRRRQELMAARRAAETGLEDFIPTAPAPAVVEKDLAQAPPPTEPNAEPAPASDVIYLVLAGLSLAALLFLAFTRRESLRAAVAALAARIRRGQEEEEPPPPIDLSRIARVTRASSTSTGAGQASEMRGAETAPAESPLPVGDPPRPASPPVEPASGADAADDSTDDLVLLEPGDPAGASAAINAARTQPERSA